MVPHHPRLFLRLDPLQNFRQNHSRHDSLLFPDKALEMHGEGSVRPAVSNVNLFIVSIKNNAGLHRRVGGSILKHLPLAGR
jgi:hypothetical protein